jgi:thiol-disulfide isomerase/thioredoxin
MADAWLIAYVKRVYQTVTQQLASAGPRGRVSSGRLWLRKFALALVLVAFVSGATYGASQWLKWRNKEKEAAEVAAIVFAATRASADTSVQAESTAVLQSLNKMVSNATFTDLSGKESSLRDYRGKVLVISMTSVDCPISRKMIPALARLSEEFRSDRVSFLVVNTDKDATPARMEDHSTLLPDWRYVHDDDGRVAGTLAARTTTETFVIDEAQTLQYRGCIDDRYDVGVTRPIAGSGYLHDAIATVLNHESASVRMTRAPGCPLDAATNKVCSSPVTWYNQISRLVQNHCTECHRPGEAAPFSLENYEQVVARKARIDYALKEQIMPPWFADHSFGKWRNERFVSDEDRRMFSRWISEGCPKGDPADAPVPVKRASGWTIRQPDIVIDAGAQEIPAEGFVEWRKFPVAFEVTNDLWVTEAEIRPSEPEVVHHAMLFVEYPKDDPRRLTQTPAESQESEGGNGFWLSYFPGRKAMVLPPGRAKLIPRNGRIFIQLHYNPNGTATVDQTRIGLKVLAGPPEKAVVSGSIIDGDFVIPPNSRVQFLHSEVFSEDVRLLALMPHMHSRGASASVFLKHPDGRCETLLNVPAYNFNWQVAYEFREPMLVTRGSRIVIQHEYDNTDKNPENPDPSKEVRHGMATSDEMMINFFDWEPAGDGNRLAKNTRRPFR